MSLLLQFTTLISEYRISIESKLEPLVSSRRPCQAMTEQWKVLQLGHLAGTSVSRHPTTTTCQSQRTSTGIRNRLNPFKKQTVRPSDLTPLRLPTSNRQLLLKFLPSWSRNRTEILPHLNIRGKCESEPGRDRGLLSTALNFLHFYDPVCRAACLLSCCASCVRNQV